MTGTTANGDSTFRAILREKKTHLEHVLRKRDGITIEKSPDQSDEIQYAYERDLVIRNLDRESNLLREVNAALRRIDDGDFGICLRCDATIGARRLAALPWASRCLQCQAATDQNGSGADNAASLLDGD